MKKILFLGGAPTQLPPIRYARERGYFAITADYLPDNPGHKLSNKYYNISTTDKDAVLDIAKAENIDGIVAYASDPAAPTAAYVAEKMGLPGNPYKSVETLARKDLFRTFLSEHEFNVPRSKAFNNKNDARLWLNQIGVPAFVKPVDSSGSKGVSCIDKTEQLEAAYAHALSFSRINKVIIEEKIDSQGYQVDSDIFMANGQLIFWAWGNQHQDKYCHPYAPVAISFPSVLPPAIQEKAKNTVFDILKHLGFTTGAFNVEFVVDRNDAIWIIEIGPRNGGNLIPEVLKHATGFDMVAATVEVAIGNPPPEAKGKEVQGNWSSVIIHSRSSGKFRELYLSERARKYTMEKNIQVKAGEPVNVFNGSHDTLGTMIMKYPNRKIMLEFLDNMEQEIRVNVD